MSTVTLVITSCGRFELLEKTISSLVNRYPFTEKIIIEDSGNVKVINKIKRKIRFSNESKYLSIDLKIFKPILSL